MNNYFVILAAGKSKRFRKKIPKQFYNYKNKEIINHSIEKSVNSIKKITSLPVLVGFGINSHQQIKELNQFSDGCVVGSAIIKILENAIQKKSTHQKILNNINYFLKQLKKNDNL